MKKFIILFFLTCCIFLFSIAQPDRWQQRVKYNMNIDVDVNTNRFTGKQKLEYSNNSPVGLNKVYYHLYFNAFQPNSSMDVRSQELGKVLINNRPDWDGRVKERIKNLKEDEIGYQKIISLKMNGVAQPFKYHETILEVNLTKPIAAKSKVIFEMEFEAQVPLQIRRSGRDNPTTGVRFSMSQWYPKLCEYDYEGWHPTPYVAREFYGVWGDFDVTINIDKTYKLGGTGVLMNANEIGWGYDSPGTELKPTANEKRSWHFVGQNIHDFVWTADPDYKHLVYKMPNGGPTLHSIYNFRENDSKNDSAWGTVLTAAAIALPYIEKSFGKYPYPQYSFIQGGDGGMEYPMATLLVGPGLGTVFHEWLHSWYQMMLGTNESMYAWMDEGFTTYAEDLVSKFYNKKSSLQGLRELVLKNPENKNLKELADIVPEDQCDAYAGYYMLAKSGFEEPMTTHSDHYNSNFGYGNAAYSKGAVFMEQLGYIVGADIRNKILLDYYKKWRFKHPNANDFIRVAEDVSGIQLDWYKEYWVSTTKTIDYKIDSLWETNGITKIRLKRTGYMPMPIDLQLTFNDGSTQMFYVPLNLMFGNKPNENNTQKREVLEEWKWTHPTYVVEMKRRLTEIKIAEIDPSKRMADIERKNNRLELNW
jgi:Peptidase family M1 domain